MNMQQKCYTYLKISFVDSFIFEAIHVGKN